MDFDLEKGIMVYELEIKTDEYKYDYDINAKTGDVLKVDKESRGANGGAGAITDDD